MLRKSLAPLAIAALTFSACAPNSKNSDSHQINGAGILADSNLTPQQKSEQLAEAAEQLLTPGGMIYASTIAHVALEQDPTNRKAQFIFAVLGPLRAMKGVVKRLEPLVQQRPQDWESYKIFEDGVRRSDMSPATVAYLFDGPADIHTESEAQEMIGQITVQIDELRRTLAYLKDGDELTLEIADEALKAASLQEALEGCEVTETAPLVYSSTGCPVNPSERRMNRADFEILEQVVAGYETYVTVSNAWDLSGIYTKALPQTGSVQDALNTLTADPNFGRLRTNNSLALIPDLTTDAIAGLRYAQKMQSSLCGQGHESAKNRPGYVFDRGLCVDSSSATERAVSMVQMLISGQMTPITGEIDGRTMTVNVNGRSFFDHPINDIRSQLPIETDAQNRITRIGDGNFGGVFQNGDLNKILSDSRH